jgi:hypothetical protein
MKIRICVLALVTVLAASAAPLDGPGLFLPRVVAEAPLPAPEPQVVPPTQPAGTPACPTSSLTVQFVMEPPSTLLDVVPKAHGLTYWEVDISALYYPNGPTNPPVACLIYFPQLRQIPGAPALLSQQSSLLNLQGAAQKSGWARLAAVARDTAMLAGPAVGIVGLLGTIPMTVALDVTTGLGGAATYGPTIANDLQGLAPNPAGLMPQQSYPLVLQPGVWVTDYEFSARLQTGHPNKPNYWRAR